MKRPGKSSAIRAQSSPEPRLLTLAWKETLADLTPGLAHDLNNTLTGILALSDSFLSQIKSTHSFHEGLSLIKQKTQQASQLIHHVARLHQEKTGYQSYIDLNSLAAEVVEILEKLAPKRIEVSAKLAARPLPVYADAVEFRRILLSLATSAVNAIPSQGKIQFRPSRQGNCANSPSSGPVMACLALIVSGSGFTPSQGNASLLNAGETPHDMLDAPHLSFLHAKCFTEKHGGDFSVQSSPGKPLSLKICLPEVDLTKKISFPLTPDRYIK